MQKLVSARNFDLGEKLKKHAEGEMDNLTKFFESIISCELVLAEGTKQHLRTAELKVKVYNTVINATAEANDIYSAMGEAFDRVRTQLKKHKDKLKEKDHLAITRTKTEATRPKTDVEEVDI